MLNAYWSVAAPLVTCRYGREVEKFIGDGVVALFNRRGDQADQADGKDDALDAYVLLALPF